MPFWAPIGENVDIETILETMQNVMAPTLSLTVTIRNTYFLKQSEAWLTVKKTKQCIESDVETKIITQCQSR